MTSLTKVAAGTRKLIRWGITLTILVILGKVGFEVGFKIYRYYYPAPPPPPTVSFGKLPKLPFEDQTDLSPLNFTLETPSGDLPKFPLQAKVYFMPKLLSNLLSLDDASDKAKNLGFEPQGEKLSDTLYRYKSKDGFLRLELNIVTGVFSISYDLKTDPSPLLRKPPAPEIAAALVKSYLSNAGVFPEDLSDEPVHEFLKVEEEKFTTGLSLSEANLVKINFFRKKYDELPSSTLTPNQGNIWFIVSGAREKEKQIVGAEFHYYPIDESTQSTYPIKTSDLAWEELTIGKAYVANPGQNENGNVTIRRIYLSYFDPDYTTEIYQPIVVFEGDNNFTAYLPAVTDDYYQN